MAAYFPFCVVQFKFIVFYNECIKNKGGYKAMNTDKIYAEAIANEYAPKDTSKVVALKKLDRKAKQPANILYHICNLYMITEMCSKRQ